MTISTDNRGAIPEHFRNRVLIDEDGNVLRTFPWSHANMSPAQAKIEARAIADAVAERSNAIQ